MDGITMQAAGGALMLTSLENPNRMPFKGVLSYFGVPSDQAPGGSGGLKVLIPVEVGEKALPSLAGMPVNLSAQMDDHDTSRVIGYIEKAMLGEVTAKGTEVIVEGYLFAKNFPSEAAAVKLTQNQLGFSYETTRTVLAKGEYAGEEVAVAESLIFTGAAILYKNSAAYTSTSLAAKNEPNKEDFKMNEEQLKELMASISGLGELVKGVKADMDSVKAEVSEIKASNEQTKIEAGEIKAAAEAKAKEDADAKAAELAAAANKEPERRSEQTLVTKFAEVKAGEEKKDLFASIDSKKMDPISSMAAKLEAVFLK